MGGASLDRKCPRGRKTASFAKAGGKRREVAMSFTNGSSLSASFCWSWLRSDSRPARIVLQSVHRCLPSKVFSSASLKEACCEKLITIPVQATDCRMAQCAPIPRMIAPTTNHR